MITIDFQLDEASLAEDIHYSPESANPAALEETYFIMPVRLCISGVELLEQPNQEKHIVFIGVSEQNLQQIQLSNDESQWLPLPLLGFATHALQALNKIELGGELKLNLGGGGHLVFARRNDLLFVTSSINGRSSSTLFSEALAAFQDFSDKVQKLLVSRIPIIQEHPFWHKWFG